MSPAAPFDRQQLKVYLLELRAELNRMDESIQQMQRRAGQLLALFQRENQALSERMYQDLEQAIVEAGGDVPAAALRPMGQGTLAAVPKVAAPHRLRAVPGSPAASRQQVSPP